jgi:hypothetical protein
MIKQKDRRCYIIRSKTPTAQIGKDGSGLFFPFDMLNKLMLFLGDYICAPL